MWLVEPFVRHHFLERFLEYLERHTDTRRLDPFEGVHESGGCFDVRHLACLAIYLYKFTLAILGFAARGANAGKQQSRAVRIEFYGLISSSCMRLRENLLCEPIFRWVDLNLPIVSLPGFRIAYHDREEHIAWLVTLGADGVQILNWILHDEHELVAIPLQNGEHQPIFDEHLLVFHAEVNCAMFDVEIVNSVCKHRDEWLEIIFQLLDDKVVVIGVCLQFDYNKPVCIWKLNWMYFQMHFEWYFQGLRSNFLNFNRLLIGRYQSNVFSTWWKWCNDRWIVFTVKVFHTL